MDNKGRFLVECHFPLNFISTRPNLQYLWETPICNPFREWQGAMNGEQLIPDKRRYGRLNNSNLMFWIESVDKLQCRRPFSFYRGNAMPFFEMCIRTSVKTSAVYETLRGLNGPHFFMVNMNMDPSSTPDNIKVKNLLTPILMAKYYPHYEVAMDRVFGDLIPFFKYDPDPTVLPQMALRY